MEGGRVTARIHPEVSVLLVQRTKMLEAFVPVGALPHYAAVVRPDHLPRTEVHCLFSRCILVQGARKYDGCNQYPLSLGLAKLAEVSREYLHCGFISGRAKVQRAEL